MTGRPGASRGTRKSFAVAYAAVTLAALVLVAAGFQWAHPRAQVLRLHPVLAQMLRSNETRPDVPVEERHADIPSAAWGHVAHGARMMVVTLGPAADRRRKYEHSSGRIDFASAGLAVSNDGGKSFFMLRGEPMGRCGYHWQGYGVNAILATHTCVPGWATSSTGRPAQQWLRIENLVPFARMVAVRFM
jgi:hypothetical protein